LGWGLRVSVSIEDVVNAIVDRIERDDIAGAVKLFESLSPPEALDVVVRLDSDSRRKLILASSLSNLVEVMARLPDEVIFEIASIKGVDDLAKIFSRLHVDDAADVLVKIPPKVRAEVLKVLPHELSAEIAKVMKYSPESVGGIMTTQVPVFEEDLTVGEAVSTYINKVKLGLYDKHNYVYVVNKERKLVGRIDVRTLLTKPRELKLRDCAEKVNVYVNPLKDREEAARLTISYDLVEVPVVDPDGVFLGIVSLDDLLDVVVSEHTEDLLKYGGFLDVIRGSYITTSPLKLAVRRIPMIVYLYLINLITGGIVASFEGVIQKVAILAAFMPILADNSGNIGSQASALILRSLVTGEVRLSRSDIAKVILKEFSTTTIMLLLLAPLAFCIGLAIPFATLKDTYLALRVATTVTLALITSCYVADIVGALLPIVLAKLRVDPAAASAPLVTSIGDILTVLTYFTVATLMLGL
jgi:magnesium transporter